MSAADLQTAPIACLEIQIASEAEGFRVGDLVTDGEQVGRLAVFKCRGDDRPGAWVLFTVPGSKRGETIWRYVKLAQLVRVKP